MAQSSATKESFGTPFGGRGLTLWATWVRDFARDPGLAYLSSVGSATILEKKRDLLWLGGKLGKLHTAWEKLRDAESSIITRNWSRI